MTKLPEQAHSLLVIDGNHSCAAWMVDDLEVGAVPVGQFNMFNVHGDDATAEDGGDGRHWGMRIRE
jgi:hypothetical protein